MDCRGARGLLHEEGRYVRMLDTSMSMILALLLAPAASSAETGKIYWTDPGSAPAKIQRSDLDGSNVEDLVTTGLSIPRGIALGLVTEQMYWIDVGTSKIQRAGLDGTDVEDLPIAGLLVPLEIDIDEAGAKMYWTDRDAAKIQRADLDGTNVEDVVATGLSKPSGIAFDRNAQKIYWTDFGTRKIQRADLDGSNVEDLVTLGLEVPRGIAIGHPHVIPTVSGLGVVVCGLLLAAIGAITVNRRILMADHPERTMRQEGAMTD